MTKEEIKKYLNSREFTNDLDKNIDRYVKNSKVLDDKVNALVKKALENMYKTLWTKRSFWSSDLKGK